MVEGVVVENDEDVKLLRLMSFKISAADSEDYVKEFSSLSLHSIKINTIDDPSNQRFVNFYFHDPSKRRSMKNKLKVDSGAAANVIPVPEYRKMYPERFDVSESALQRFIKKSNRR